MKLSAWIDSVGGRKKAAQILGVTPEAIHYWLAGKSTPTWTTVFLIFDKSEGKVSPREIFEATKLKERLGKAGVNV